MLFQNKIIADKINKDTEYRIAAAAGGIMKGFFIHHLAEGRIKEVNNV